MSNNVDSTQPPADSGDTSASAPRRKWLTPTLALAAVLVVGVFGGVLIGHATASSAQGSSSTFSRGPNGAGAGGGTGAGFAGGGFTSGTIVSISGSTMIVKAQDGTQKTVTIASSTRLTKTSSATVSDFKAGQTVTVIGATGSTGDIAATSVSEGARGFGGRLGGGGTGGGAGGGGTGGGANG